MAETKETEKTEALTDGYLIDGKDIDSIFILRKAPIENAPIEEETEITDQGEKLMSDEKKETVTETKAEDAKVVALSAKLEEMAKMVAALVAAKVDTEKLSAEKEELAKRVALLETPNRKSETATDAKVTAFESLSREAKVDLVRKGFSKGQLLVLGTKKGAFRGAFNKNGRTMVRE